MSNPTPGDVHVNRPLTVLSVAYMQEAAGFVADRAFPNVPVQKQSDTYWQYDRKDFRRDQFRLRAPGTESAGGGWKMSTDPYFARQWSLHKDLTEQDIANADDVIQLEQTSSEWLAEQGLINREVQFVTKYMTTGVWSGIDGASGDMIGQTASPNGNEFLQWNDASSTPIEDVKAQADNIHKLCGKRPNRLVMGRQVWTKLSDHPDLVDRIKYSGGVGNATPAMVSRQAAAALMEIDEIMVMDGVYDTSEENPDFEASMSAAFIGGKNALLVYSAPRAGLKVMSGGITFSWVGLLGAGATGMRIKRIPMDHISSVRIEADMAYDRKILCPDAGVYFSAAVA